MTIISPITLPEYIEIFLERPEEFLGPFAKIDRAWKQGLIKGFSDSFREYVGEVALSLKPASPIVVCGASRQEAVSRVESLLTLLTRNNDDSGLFTFAWKAEDGFLCPYRHDPILLLPEKSRQEVLSEAARKVDFSYPLALESTRHCPWCEKRYREALAGAEGVWQTLAEDVTVCSVEDAPEDAWPGERLLAANRGAVVYFPHNGSDVADVVKIVEGGGSWPPVVGFVFIPVAEDELESWNGRPEIAGALKKCWLRNRPWT